MQVISVDISRINSVIGTVAPCYNWIAASTTHFEIRPVISRGLNFLARWYRSHVIVTFTYRR